MGTFGWIFVNDIESVGKLDMPCIREGLFFGFSLKTVHEKSEGSKIVHEKGRNCVRMWMAV